MRSYLAAVLVAAVTGSFVAATNRPERLRADPQCSCTTTANDNVGTAVPCLGTGNATNRSCSAGGLGEACTTTENVSWSPTTPNCIASVQGVSGKIVALANTTGGTLTFDATWNNFWPNHSRSTTAASGHCTTGGTVFGWKMLIGDDTSIRPGCICAGGPAFTQVARSEWLCKK